jgi:Zn finger protein HypA/HybF involved in hydrogenase expression
LPHGSIKKKTTEYTEHSEKIEFKILSVYSVVLKRISKTESGRMKVQCPKCKKPIPADQINIATDIAFCPQCNDAFKVSESVDLNVANPDVLQNPPRGTWFRQEVDRVVVGASTRSPIAFFLVPFMCVWSGFSLGGIYGTQIISGEFSLVMSLFGLPFLLASILFWGLALMTICGKVEVSIGQESSIFVGIGGLGWTRYFDWFAVRNIQEAPNPMQCYGGGYGAFYGGIFLEGPQRIRFGAGINEQRRYFLLHALKYLKAETFQQSF